jgi:acyl carrier protein
VTVTSKRDEVQRIVFDSLVDFGADPELVSLDATLEELDVDSLDLVELAQIAEEEFGVTFNADDAQGVRTVRDALEMIVARMP